MGTLTSTLVREPFQIFAKLEYEIVSDYCRIASS